ncbi:MAG: prepilin-type N-terminal cleavage/methylation domain-containing protein, partial [Planctomycetes bacterium]|nr:prepilin-type N-terminal cleavage/methylation domain-containing protein [Planctomycetota bacterium]
MSRKPTELAPSGDVAPKAGAAPSAGGSRRRGAGFSLIEMLIAIAISSAVLTSMMVALDTMFKGYQQTSGAVSTNVVARIAVNRVLGMIRGGSDFG